MRETFSKIFLPDGGAVEEVVEAVTAVVEVVEEVVVEAVPAVVEVVEVLIRLLQHLDPQSNLPMGATKGVEGQIQAC